MSTVYLEKVIKLPQIYKEEDSDMVEEGVPLVSRKKQREFEAEMLEAVAELDKRAKEIWRKFLI